MELMNISIYDNGAAFLIRVNGLTVSAHNSLADAWRHIIWMYRIESQNFTVGKNAVPVTQWIEGMKLAGYIDDDEIREAK